MMHKSIQMIATSLLLISSVALAKDSFQSNITQLYEVQKNNTSAFVLYVPSESSIEKNETNAWSSFNTCAFIVPHMLREAASKKTPVVLLVPEYYMVSQTINDEAPWLEGARVALSWASSYFRFKDLGGVDVRVVLMPNQIISTLDFNDVVSGALNKKIQDTGVTPEARMNGRIFNFQDVIKESD